MLWSSFSPQWSLWLLYTEEHGQWGQADLGLIVDLPCLSWVMLGNLLSLSCGTMCESISSVGLLWAWEVLTWGTCYLGLYFHLDFWTVWMMISVSMLELWGWRRRGNLWRVFWEWWWIRPSWPGKPWCWVDFKWPEVCDSCIEIIVSNSWTFARVHPVVLCHPCLQHAFHPRSQPTFFLSPSPTPPKLSSSFVDF